MPDNPGKPNGQPNGQPQPQPQPAGGGGMAAAPAVHIPKQPTKQDIRQDIISQPYPLIPHVQTYAGQYNVVNKTYATYFDEALRDSQANTLVMRRDGLVDELIRHRISPILSLSHHIEVDDPEHPDQAGISQTLNKIILDIPYLKYLIRTLLEASFYGKYASQIQLGSRKVSGNEWNSVIRHIPVNGDKLRYKWDGTPGIAVYSGSKSSEYNKDNKELEKLEPYIKNTMLGKALFLETPFLRDRFIIHKFEPSDTDYLFEIDEALSVQGLGLRSRLYWIWNVRTELLGWMIDAMQRVGANGMIYAFYQSGNYQMQNDVLQSLRQLVKDNISAFPYNMPGGNPKDMLNRIEPSAVGYEVMMNLVQHLESIMRRDFLGQDLSSQSSPTGMGSEVAQLQGDVRIDYIEYDSSNLADSLTTDLVKVILRYNKWKYEGKVLSGDDLPFSAKWKYVVDRQNISEKMEAANSLYQMGVPLDQDEVRKAGGYGPPKKKSSVLINHQLEQVAQQNRAGTPATDHLHDSMKGIVKSGKEAQQAGMLGGRPGSTRFGKKPEEVSVLAGRLYLSKSGWGLMKVPNALVRGVFDAIHSSGVILPPQDSDLPKNQWKLNAHVSVLRPDELEKIGGPDTITEWGHHFHYQLGPVKRVNPKGWDGMKEVYFIDIDSPELEDMREKYGLTRLPNKNKFRFHISVAVKPVEKGSGTVRFLRSADDCGHTDSGEFDFGNICALLRRDIAAAEKSGMLYNQSKGFKQKLERRLWEVNRDLQDDPENEDLVNEEKEIHDTLDHLGKRVKHEKVNKAKHESMSHLRSAANHIKESINTNSKTERNQRLAAIHKGVVSANNILAGNPTKNDLNDAHFQLEYSMAVARIAGDKHIINEVGSALKSFNSLHGSSKSPSKSRYQHHAGDPDDCGHELAKSSKAGKFSEGNTCAGEGGQTHDPKDIEKSFNDYMEGENLDVLSRIDKEPGFAEALKEHAGQFNVKDNHTLAKLHNSLDMAIKKNRKPQDISSTKSKDIKWRKNDQSSVPMIVGSSKNPYKDIVIAKMHDDLWHVHGGDGKVPGAFESAEDAKLSYNVYHDMFGDHSPQPRKFVESGIDWSFKKADPEERNESDEKYFEYYEDMYQGKYVSLSKLHKGGGWKWGYGSLEVPKTYPGKDSAISDLNKFINTFVKDVSTEKSAGERTWGVNSLGGVVELESYEKHGSSDKGHHKRGLHSEKSTYAKAGSAEDCGHTQHGKFDLENICAKGSGRSFQSPNTMEYIGFDRAYRQFRSGDQNEFLRQSKEIDRKLGLNSNDISAIGDWADGSESSVISSYSDIKSYDQVREAAAIKGLAWNQKAVIPFAVDPDGEDRVYELTVKDSDLKGIRSRLDEAGIEFRSIVPGKSGTRVLVFDKGDKLSDNISRFGENYEGKIQGTTYKGQGEFLGADTRTEARKVYREAIKASKEGRERSAGISKGHHGGDERKGDGDRGRKGSEGIIERLRSTSNSLPPKIRKPLAKFAHAYSSTYESANHAAKVLARKHGMDKKQADTLGRVLALGDIAGFVATSGISYAAGLGFLGRNAAGFVPAASASYLLWSGAKNPVETLAAARKAVSRSFRKMKTKEKFHMLSR